MSDSTTVVITDPTPEPDQAETAERTLGRLEAETEHLSETVETLEAETETAQQQAETATEIAIQSAETAWATQSDLLQLRTEVAELMEMFREESEGGPESQETEVIELPEPTPEPGPVEMESENQGGFLGTMRKLLHGR